MLLTCERKLYLTSFLEICLWLGYTVAGSSKWFYYTFLVLVVPPSVLPQFTHFFHVWYLHNLFTYYIYFYVHILSPIGKSPPFMIPFVLVRLYRYPQHKHRNSKPQIWESYTGETTQCLSSQACVTSLSLIISSLIYFPANPTVLLFFQC